MSNAAFNPPFHATESEQRLIRELLAVAELRKDQALLATEASELATWGINSSAKWIAYLKAHLYPQETKLITQRAERLKPLQTNFLRAHFDQTLETATITLNAKIRNTEDYNLLCEKLKTFDFETWARDCDAERSDAD